MPVDYNEKKNRQELAEKIVKLKNDTIVHIFIRILTYCECRPSQPERQEFWQYLEEIVSQNDAVQPTLPLTLMEKSDDYMRKNFPQLLDKAFASKL